MWFNQNPSCPKRGFVVIPELETLGFNEVAALLENVCAPEGTPLNPLLIALEAAEGRLVTLLTALLRVFLALLIALTVWYV